MALVMTWSYFHHRVDTASPLTNNFLLIAPNIIVFERLEQDFANNKIFKELPLIPPEWTDQWDVQVVARGQSQQLGNRGNIIVTNIQQLYEATNEDTLNPVAQLVGPPPASQPHPAIPLLDRIRSLTRLMVFNDEAHHLHDDTLKWNETLLGLDSHLGPSGGLTAWLDFSATPKNQHGTFFPWIVSDYPLAQAVEDRIVKTPLIIHQTDKADPDKYSHDEAGDAFNEWIAVAVARWREHVRDYGALGERPILFVMAETTKEADSIAARLEREGDLRDRVLTLHVNERGGQRGEISDRDLRLARQAARDIDAGTSNYRAVVSVLMLREGWDVRNVSVILGLRPFSAKANILPEQAVGRGLRLMRGIPRGSTQILELIGTHAFENFVRELEREGLGVGTEIKPPAPPTRVQAVAERNAYDISIPRTTSLFEREYKNLESLQPATLGALVDANELEDNARQQIQLLHGTVDVKVHEAEVSFEAADVPPIQNVLASLTNRVMRRARLTDGFRTLYPIVRGYVIEYCFGRTVDCESVSVRRALDNGAVIDAIAGLFARHIGEVTVEKRVVRVVGAPLRLSETKEFLWRRMTSSAEKTIFSCVACFNSFEADFASFLDRSVDVRRFAKLCEWFTEFHVQYVKSSGALGSYYPDFVVVQDGAPEANWIVETKGHEDAEVPAKDAQMTRWCEDVSNATGATWRYLKVPYRLFYDVRPQSLSELVSRLGSASPQLVMPASGVSL
jgi:type III restriction enzyme